MRHSYTSSTNLVSTYLSLSDLLRPYVAQPKCSGKPTLHTQHCAEFPHERMTQWIISNLKFLFLIFKAVIRLLLISLSVNQYGTLFKHCIGVSLNTFDYWMKDDMTSCHDHIFKFCWVSAWPLYLWNTFEIKFDNFSLVTMVYLNGLALKYNAYIKHDLKRYIYKHLYERWLLWYNFLDTRVLRIIMNNWITDNGKE